MEDLVRQIIKAIGDDPDRDGLIDTPKRVIKSWAELYSGYQDSVKNHLRVFESKYDQIILLRDIDFFSTCEHHMLPFFGKCHIAYLPNGGGKVLGVSKLARIVNVFSRRLQIQEKMTQDIAAAIQESLDAKGVAVLVEGMHLCMVARGVGQQHATMTTSCMLGKFRESTSARIEVLNLINGMK